jgi:dihydrofolate synthase/folylpolyglutamate synthase
VLDVSHNAQAAEALADALRRMPLAGRTHAVLGMMRDKDVASFVRLLQPLVDCWYTVGLHTPRASPPQELAASVAAVIGTAQAVSCWTTVAEALAAVKRDVGTGDRVLVCGSFHTVAEWARLQPCFD